MRIFVQLPVLVCLYLCRDPIADRHIRGDAIHRSGRYRVGVSPCVKLSVQHTHKFSGFGAYLVNAVVPS